MKTFTQFLEELQNMYDANAIKIKKNPEIKLSKKEKEFIKQYHNSNPKLKSHDELHNTLGQSNLKLKNVTPYKKEKDHLLAHTHRRFNQPDDVG